MPAIPHFSAILHSKWLAVAIGFVLFALYALQIWLHTTQTSAVIDESPHILAGYRAWRCGDFGVNVEHPPLVKLLATAPLIGRTLIEPGGACGAAFTPKDVSFFHGSLLIVKNGVDSIVIPARLEAALISLALAALVVLAAREMFGRWEAVTAMALLAFEPNLIAHGSLVTTDMGLTTGIFAAVYAFYRYLKHPSIVRLLLVGLAVGFTLSAKHSGLLVLPILLLLLLADAWLSRDNKRKTVIRAMPGSLLRLTAVSFVGFTVLWTCYGFRYSALPAAAPPAISAGTFPARHIPHTPDSLQPADAITGRLLRANGQFHVVPEAYALGLADILHTFKRPTWLLGKSYPSGQWFYFPIALLIKTSIALLLSLTVALCTARLYRVHRREMVFLLVPPLAFLAINMASALNIGIRHILPVYPFFIVIASAGVCYWSRNIRAVQGAFLSLLIFHAVTAARVAPNYIAFANDCWGGSNNVEKLLYDSNVDWGQNIKLVNKYVQQENLGQCWIGAFGSGELLRAQQPCRIIPGSFGWDMTEQPVPATPPVIEGTVFLSSSLLPPHAGSNYAAFARARPIALIGGTIYVYRGRFEIPVIAGRSHAARMKRWMQLKRYAEAAVDGRKATVLLPGDPTVHLTFGQALARSNMEVEARREFEKALRLTQRTPGQYLDTILQTRLELKRLAKEK